MNCPKTSHAAILSGLIAIIATHHSFTDIYPAERAPAALMTICFLTIAISGVVQIALGAARLGAVVKFIPHPVLAGFINGFALQIIVGQAHRAFGLDTEMDLWNALLGMSPILPWATGLAAFSIILMLIVERWFKKVPSALVGLVGGTLLYLALSRHVDPAAFGQVIGNLPPRMNLVPHMDDIAEFIQSFTFARHVFPIVATGFTLALVSSIQSLLSISTADRLFETRHNSNRELMVQGASNLLAAVFGGTPSGGSPNITQTVYSNGGRTQRANLAYAATLVALAVGLGPLISQIPVAVMAAVVITSTAGAMDKWTQQLVKRIGSSSSVSRKEIALNLVVVVAVTAIVVGAGALAALGVGMTLAFIIFLYRNNAKVVRRVYYGDHMRSRTSRSPSATDLLNHHGRRIAVIELEGPLFFGSSETVATYVETESAAADWIVLDCRRVGHFDSSGAMTLKRIDATLRKGKKTLFLSYLPSGGNRRLFLKSMGLGEPEKEGRIFEDSDAALALAEDQLLVDAGYAPTSDLEIEPAAFEVLQGLSAEELVAVTPHLVRRGFAAEKTLIAEGETNCSMFFLSKGRINIRTECDGRLLSLYTYREGAVFGEMAFLSGHPRSASVVAETDVVIYELDAADFDRLLDHAPTLAAKLMRNIAVGLTSTVRTQTETIRQLEA